MTKRKRPRRPIKLTPEEYKVVHLAIAKLMSDDRATKRMPDYLYRAGLGLVTHTMNDLPLYKLGYSPIPPTTDPSS